MSIVTPCSPCPRTGHWLNSQEALLFDHERLRRKLSAIAFPVMIKDRLDVVYELSDLVGFKISSLQSGTVFHPQLNISSQFKLEELVPVRYPGFKEYIETICYLQVLTSGGWVGEISDAEISVEQGAGLHFPTDAWHHSNHTALERQKLQRFILLKWRNECSLSEDGSTDSQWRQESVSSRNISLYDMLLLGGTLGVVVAAFLLGRLSAKASAQAKEK